MWTLGYKYSTTKVNYNIHTPREATDIDRRCDQRTCVKQLILYDIELVPKKVRQFATGLVQRCVIEVIIIGRLLNSRRYYYFSEGKCNRLASGLLFCCAYCTTRFGKDKLYGIPNVCRTVVSFCRLCGTKLALVSELEPMIEYVLVRKEK